MKSFGQDMDQETADELVGVERHKLIASVALGPVILPFESDALADEGDEPAVGNSGGDVLPSFSMVASWRRGRVSHPSPSIR